MPPRGSSRVTRRASVEVLAHRLFRFELDIGARVKDERDRIKSTGRDRRVPAVEPDQYVSWRHGERREA